MLVHFYVFITALFAALIAVPGLRRWAFDTGTLDLSDERKVHKGMMPRLGGVAIFLAFFFALLVFVDLSPTVRGILAGSLVLFVTGLIDDLSGLSPKRKFLGEIIGTLVTMFVSVWAYALFWGFPFALGFVLLIFVHEMGHLIVMRQQGIRAGAPMFIPFGR